MYDLVVGDGGQRSRGEFLLHILGNPEPGRFRDAWVEQGDDGEPVIVIYTRNGGGNRECYCLAHPEPGCLEQVIEDLQAGPLYLSDEDDDGDRTYASFRFRCPPEVRDLLAEVAGGRRDMDAEWQRALSSLLPSSPPDPLKGPTPMSETPESTGVEREPLTITIPPGTTEVTRWLVSAYCAPLALRDTRMEARELVETAEYGEYDGDVEFIWQPQDITVDDSPEELYAKVSGDEMTTEYTVAPLVIRIGGGA